MLTPLMMPESSVSKTGNSSLIVFYPKILFKRHKTLFSLLSSIKIQISHSFRMILLVFDCNMIWFIDTNAAAIICNFYAAYNRFLLDLIRCCSPIQFGARQLCYRRFHLPNHCRWKSNAHLRTRQVADHHALIPFRCLLHRLPFILLHHRRRFSRLSPSR